MRSKRSIASGCFAASSLCSLSIALLAPPAAAEMRDLHASSGAQVVSDVYALSADGNVAAGDVGRTGFLGRRAFRWTRANGMAVHLDELNNWGVGGNGGQSDATAQAITPDGDVIVGYADDASGFSRGFRWTPATGRVALGAFSGGNTSYAKGVSADGEVVVGYGDDPSENYSDHALFWTRKDRARPWAENNVDLRPLKNLRAGEASSAYGISADGSVIVGGAQNGGRGYYQAVRWTPATDMVETLDNLNHGFGAFATGISGDGNVIVGYANDGAAGNAEVAVRWTQAGVVDPLGSLNGGTTSKAYAASYDGSVIVGSATDGTDGNNSRAFRWTQATGLQSVEQWLRTNGVPVAAGLETDTAHATNRDGSVVAGLLANGHAFVARLGNDGTATGLIDVVDYDRTLLNVAYIPTQAIAQSELVLHGLHGSPMRGLPTAGQRTVWVGGDWGRQENLSGDGDVGNGEVGVAFGLTNHVQLKAAVGEMQGEQSLAYNGRVRVHGPFVVPEVIVALPGTPLRASASGYYSVGAADVRRGYLNAGTAVASTGSPRVETAGLRLRLDWLDAVRRGDFGLTPYTSVTRYRTRMDGYTEQGGGFPVRWDGRKEQSTFSRVGTDATYALNSRWTLLGRLEEVHRFEARSTGATGTILGMNTGFTFDGLDYKRDWMRAAVGAEAHIGPGTASLMLNASTETNGPVYWAYANYRLVL